MKPLISHIAEDARFIACPYRPGVDVREDVFAQRFSVICTGSYLDSNEEGYWKLGATIVGHCALLEEAREIAQAYLKRDCFVFNVLVNDNDTETEQVTFDPDQFLLCNAQGEVVFIALAGFIESEWTFGRFKSPTDSDLRLFTCLTSLMTSPPYSPIC